MGVTALDEVAVAELLAGMSREWTGSSYDLLHKNCCHFADALCVALGVGGAPPWLNRAANAGAGLVDGAESLKNSLQQLNPVAADTGEAVEKVLERLDSRFRLSERLLAIEARAVDRMSAFNQKLVQHPVFAEACRVSFEKVIVDGDAGVSPLGAELAVWVMYAQLNALLPVYLDAPPRDEVLKMFRAVDRCVCVRGGGGGTSCVIIPNLACVASFGLLLYLSQSFFASVTSLYFMPLHVTSL